MVVTEQNQRPNASDSLNRTMEFRVPQGNSAQNAVPGQRVPPTNARNNAQRPVQPRPAQQSVQPRPAQQSVQPRPAQQSAQPRPAQQSIEPRPAQQAAKPRPAQPNRASAEARKRSDAMSTKTAEMKIIPSAKKTTAAGTSALRNPKEKKEKKERTKFADGEGGNTIISVIKAIVYIIFVVVVSVVASMFIILVGNDVFAFVKNDEVRDIVIPEDADLDSVAELLHENDIIAYPQIFKLYANIKGDGKQEYEFVAGTYSISPMYNYDELLVAFKEKVDNGIQDIMIPEGYTTDEIIDLFVSKGIGTKEGFVEAINNYDFDYWFIDELGEDWAKDGRIYRLDGYLFPDTYQFYNSSSEVAVIRKLLKRFNQIFTEEHRSQCAAMGYTVDEMITLASMIEKEAGTASEFFYVSSVFHNRLNNPSAYPKLESDATIVYAIQHETGERPNLTSTTYETPYNTYTYGGLPPGPIANPSASAILAALMPAKSNYYFFLSVGGVTKFSETRQQHEALIAELKGQNAES